MAQELRSRLLDEAAVLLAEACAEHRVLQRLQGGLRHVLVDPLDRAGPRLAPAREHRRAGGRESRHVSEHVLGAKQRRGEPALPAPVLAFSVEQAPADRLAEHVIVERLLGIAIGIIQQHGLDQGRVHDEGRLDPEKAVSDDRLLVEILAPARHRVADHPEHQPGKGKTPLGRDGSLRYGRLSCHAVRHDLAWLRG